CPICLGKKVRDILIPQSCPFCSVNIIRGILIKICERLDRYHAARRDQARLVVQTYIEAHHNVARCVIEKRVGDILGCYSVFNEELKEFVYMESSYLDLISPELVNFDKHVRDVVDAT